jgi:hypothetical protein
MRERQPAQAISPRPPWPVVWCRQDRPLLSVYCRLVAPWSFASQLQAFFPINTVDSLVMVLLAFPPQQYLNTRESIPHSRHGDLLHPLPHGPVVAAVYRVTKHGARQQDHGTGAALRYVVVGYQAAGQLLSCRALSAFFNTSWSLCLFCNQSASAFRS